MREKDARKRASVADICTARQARFNWREGPPAEAWQLIEARIDRAGALWLTLHEYETDEYSNWLVSADADGASVVRRIPARALQGDPATAGVEV